MKRTERVGAMIKILSGAPNKIYSLQYFCDLFGAAKSSISEDIQAASAAISFTGTGYLQTVSGAKGGVKFVPDMTLQQVQAMQDEFCRRLKDPTRLLGGNFLYTSDIFSDPAFVMEMAAALSQAY